MHAERSYPVGAEFIPGGAHFRLWAPAAEQVVLVISHKKTPMEIALDAEPNGYFCCYVPDVDQNILYQFRLDNDEKLYPDPASRYQPLGPHGPSQLHNIQSMEWTDQQWLGIKNNNNVIYEMHIGTFTQQGTYVAAAQQLTELAALGITIIELMPVNEFDGNFGWGYDGVGLYAPYHGYGTPRELQQFIDEAHALGMGVILDVVYNHVGSSGCYLGKFSADYFSARYQSQWGNVFNFDGENNAPVREFIIHNTLYWLKEFHFDGFRLDATQEIFDASEQHIIAAIVSACRSAAGKKTLYIVGENEPQQRHMVAPIHDKGFGLDSLWNDDFHHIARVAMTGKTGAYFTDYTGSAQEFVASIKYGFLYQGQWYRWQQKPRGSFSLDLSPGTFIHYLQNHDQIANGGRGKRIHELSHPGLLRALTALLLLSPQTPLLFQGQEFAASAPFVYFADNNPELVDAVAKGRNEFLFQFVSLATPDMQRYLNRPEDYAAFQKSKLDFQERHSNQEIYQLHKDLLQLRHTDSVLAGDTFAYVDGAVLSPSAFVIRFFSLQTCSDRLLIINLGRDLSLSPVPEPLLAPHENHDWALAWSSESPHYGGHGACAMSTREDWLVPGFSAALLKPVPLTGQDNSSGA